MTARPLIETVRTRDVRFIGTGEIDPEGFCPCGSRRRLRSCHYDRSRWPKNSPWSCNRPAPLIVGPPTGYSHPRCYAQASNDCSEKISREHWISSSVLKIVSGYTGQFTLGGTSWLAGEKRDLSVEAAQAKILCEKHNRALSPLDRAAGRLFFSHVSDRSSMYRTYHPEHGVSVLTLTDGHLVELWLLKLFMGSMAANAFSVDTERSRCFVSDEIYDYMLDVLWRGADWPDRWGMYSQFTDPDEHFPARSIALQPRFSDSGHLEMGRVELGIISLFVLFGRPEPLDPQATYRPGQLTITDPRSDCQKILGLTWPDADHRTVLYSPTNAST